MSDIYFEKNYGYLNEAIEDGSTCVFYHEDDYGKIRYMFIKRKIPFLLESGKQYYDITTPYGYGGPLIESCKDKKKLINNFEIKFKDYCERENIVSEFIRFHPLYNNALDFKDVYSVIYLHDTVGTNLKDYDNPIEKEFSKKCKKNIKKALSKGISFRVNDRVTNLDEFINIYYSTMNRNLASSFYYFDKEYFEKCIKYFQDNIIYVQAIYNEITIAAGLYFVWKDKIHIHLSGTLKEYLNLSPAYVLRYAITKWGKDKGYKLIHHGGGRTYSPDDNLYKFKKQFGLNTSFAFYVGKKIWNPDVYEQLCKLNINKEGNFFPQYRKR